jgi:hypothetical protein
MSIKLILIGLAVAAIGGILWHDHWISKKYQATKAELVQANATITAERERAAQIQADFKLNQETSHALQERLSAIERERRDNPLPRLRCTASVPSAVTESGTAIGSDGPGAGRESETVTFDPSTQLDEYGTDCAVVAERLTALQEWERARTH